MKNIMLVILLGVLHLAGCGGGDDTASSGVTVDEYKSRINEALKQQGDKITLKIIKEDITEDGKTVLALSPNIIIFLVLNKDKTIKQANLAMNDTAYLTEMDNFKFALLLLVGTVDDSLSFGERNKVIQQLGLSDKTVFAKDYLKVINVNNIQYTYKGSFKDGSYVLRADYK